MSPLAKEVIEKLSTEQDAQVLAEVLDFYEYIKEKKLKNKWLDIQEDEPSDEELKICSEYKNSKEQVVSFEDLIKELNLHGE